MNNITAPAKSAKRTAVVNKIKQVRTPLIIVTAAVAVGVAVKWEMDSRTVLVWHQQRINDLVETSNQLLEDVRTLQQ